MLARFGYRRILPIANILLFAILLTVGYVGNNIDRSYEQGLQMAHSAEAEGWQPTYIERPTALTHLFAWSLNFPAMLFATPFGFLLKGWRADALVNSIAAGYLLILWWVVGLWLDRRRDESRNIRRTPALSAIRWTALLLATAAFLLVIGLIVARTLLHQVPEAICTVPMLFWPLFLAYAARWEIARARHTADQTVAVA